MPYSIAYRKRILLNAETKFHNDLRKLLKNDQKRMQIFNTTVQKLKAESATPATVTAKINVCMKKYPELCNRIVGFHPDGSIKLGETESALHLLVPDTPPAYFTNDIVLSVAPLLPFPSLGRLTQICKWMNAHITQAQVERALERAKGRFGKVELVTSAGYTQPVLRLFDTNEEMIEVRRMSEHSSIYILKTQKGRVYIGVSQKKSSHHTDDGSIEAISDVLQHVTTALQAKGHRETTPTVWFRFKETYCGIRYAQHALSVSFVVIRGDDSYAAHCEVFFEELMM